MVRREAASIIACVGGIDNGVATCYASRVRLTDPVIDLALRSFGLGLPPEKIRQVADYIELLTRWSQAVNLTAIREPTEVLQRHFGESMCLGQMTELRGSLLDVGTGAGFPGLAVKILCPDLRVTLLEPAVRKRTFLKEVVRTCELEKVIISGERAESFCNETSDLFDFVTLRAVGSFDTILPSLPRCLASDGRVCLWLTGKDALALTRQNSIFTGLFDWDAPIRVPLSRDREIWCGKARAGASHVSRET